MRGCSRWAPAIVPRRALTSWLTSRSRRERGRAAGSGATIARWCWPAARRCRFATRRSTTRSPVLEHSEHPEQFLAELQRVASAGYIETPSLWSERVRPFSFHRAEVTAFTDADGPMLVIRKKPAPAGDPLLERAFAEEFNRGAFEAIDPNAWVHALPLEGSDPL